MKVVQLVKDSSGRCYLRLVSSNGEVLAHSETYFSKWGAKRAARKNFPGIKLVEVDR